MNDIHIDQHLIGDVSRSPVAEDAAQPREDHASDERPAASDREVALPPPGGDTATDAVQGGKEGKPGGPSSPPLPPSAQADALAAPEGRDGAEGADNPSTSTTPSTADADDYDDFLEEDDFGSPVEVFTPAPRVNPVITALKVSGLYRGAQSPGVHSVTCPWARQHMEGDDKPAIYTEPDDVHRQGQFSCPGNHSSRLRIGNLLDALEIEPDRATGKPIIRLIPGEMGAIGDAAEQVLEGAGDYYQAGSVIVRVKRDRETGDIRTEPVNEASLGKVLATGALWLKWEKGRQSYERSDPPPRYVTMLHRMQDLKHLPVLKGLARQPYLTSDGSIVMQAGYDPDTCTLGSFNPADFELPEPTEEAARASLAELKKLLAEFHFRADHDRAAALSAILTATVRSQLPLAPAFNLSASASGSGKSYLASLIALFAGPAPAMNVSYPVRADEATKAVLTMLMPQPAVVLYDDMQTDWKAHGIINRMLTSQTISDRLLGGNKSATVSTATLVLGTGNNIEPERDLRRRVISVYLSPFADTPATLSYDGRPVDAVRAARGSFVGHALTIVRAWIAAGRPIVSVPQLASFEAWSDFCRQPLLWLGEVDPATSLIEQVQADPELEALAALLRAWHREFGMQSAMVRTVLSHAEEDREGDLYQAMLEMPFMDFRGEVNRSKFGHYLKKNVNRFAGGLQIVRADNSERNAWAVVPAGKEPVGFEAHPVRRSSSPYGQPRTPVPDARLRTHPGIDPDEIF